MRLIEDNALIRAGELDDIEAEVLSAHRCLHDRSGAGSKFTGWLDYADHYDREEYARLVRTAARIRGSADLFIVVGIGGSYLGAKAVIDATCGYFGSPRPEVVFAGQHLSGEYLEQLLDYMNGKSVYVNVISKSGTTIEPAIAFRVLKSYLEDRYGAEGARERIIATTDRSRGRLRTMADRFGYESFVIPENIGGRYSVMTPVGLLPMAAAGVDIDAFTAGFCRASELYRTESLERNACYRYAALRTILNRKGKQIEALVTYEPKLATFAEWWMQLFGESDGKDGKGLFPTRLSNTTDLHSMGQIIQDGPRILFETVLRAADSGSSLTIPRTADDLDQLNDIAGKTLEFVNRSAVAGTVEAHAGGGVPNLMIEIDRFCAESIGHLVFFFMKACAIGGYLLGVNPFNQPGVEDYKRNMFRILGRA